MTVYWVVWDAAASWIVDRLEAEGALPAVTRLRAAGIRGSARPPSPNCQTPPSLATLFTGAWPDRHGLTGFTLPGSVGEPVEVEHQAFTPGRPRCPLVWEEALAAGLRTAGVHAPWTFDAAGSVGRGVQATIEAYSTWCAPSGVLRLAEPPHDRDPGRYDWDAGPFPVTVTPSRAGALVQSANAVTVDTESGWVPVRLGPTAGFWVRHLTTPEGPALVRTGTWVPRAAGDDADLVGDLLAGEVFAGEGVKSLYRTGQLGARLVDGGDGTAEREFLGSLRCVATSFGGTTDRVLAGHDADLVVVYLPFTDDVGHEIAGWCDHASAAYRLDLEAELWGHVRRCFGWADDVLGRVLDRAGPEDTVLLCADHGIVGSRFLVALNEALAAAGLVVLDAGGRVDHRRSAVVYHPANNGLLRVNHEGYEGGCIPRQRAGEVLKTAMDALLRLPAGDGAGEAARDSGPVVTGFLDEHGAPLPPWRVDDGADSAYVVLHDDYQPTALLDGGPPVRAMHKAAAHVVNTGSRRLHATFAAAAPWLPAGADVGVVDNTAPAALVRTALGLSGSGLSGSGLSGQCLPTPGDTATNPREGGHYAHR